MYVTLQATNNPKQKKTKIKIMIIYNEKDNLFKRGILSMGFGHTVSCDCEWSFVFFVLCQWFTQYYIETVRDNIFPEL